MKLQLSRFDLLFYCVVLRDQNKTLAWWIFHFQICFYSSMKIIATSVQFLINEGEYRSSSYSIFFTSLCISFPNKNTTTNVCINLIFSLVYVENKSLTPTDNEKGWNVCEFLEKTEQDLTKNGEQLIHMPIFVKIDVPGELIIAQSHIRSAQTVAYLWSYQKIGEGAEAQSNLTSHSSRPASLLCSCLRIISRPFNSIIFFRDGNVVTKCDTKWKDDMCVLFFN